MGACLSLSSSDGGNNSNDNSVNKKNMTAKVISVNGELREYAAPVGVGDVLSAEMSSNINNNSYFVCNSDSLYFDELIPPLDSKDELRPNQIYFVLSSSKREKPLSGSDMASLAVKASQAIQRSDIKKKKKKNPRRISPVITASTTTTMFDANNNNNNESYEQYQHPRDYHYELTVGVGVGVNKKKNKNNSSSSSLRRLSSRRAKMAVRSFRLRLSTIYELS